MVHRLTALLSPARRLQALQGDVRLIQDLIPEVDLEPDHLRGPLKGAITIIEFGDCELLVLWPGRTGGARPSRRHRAAVRVETPAAHRPAPGCAPGRGRLR